MKNDLTRSGMTGLNAKDRRLWQLSATGNLMTMEERISVSMDRLESWAAGMTYLASAARNEAHALGNDGSSIHAVVAFARLARSFETAGRSIKQLIIDLEHDATDR